MSVARMSLKRPICRLWAEKHARAMRSTAVHAEPSPLEFSSPDSESATVLSFGTWRAVLTARELGGQLL